MAKVKQISKANYEQKVKQVSCGETGSGGWTRTSDQAVNPSWEGPALPLSFY